MCCRVVPFPGIVVFTFLCCSVLQRVAVCCSVLHCVVRQARSRMNESCLFQLARSLLFYIAVRIVCCSVLQCVAVCCSVLQCVAVCCSVFQCVALCCFVLQCVAVCCSVLQCVAGTYE